MAHMPADTPRAGGRRRRSGSQIAAHLQQKVEAGLTFADIGWLREVSGLPVVVKGVLRGDDAVACLDAGAAAIWVSNHGGRQLDGAVPTAEALREVVAAVGGRAEVYVDGGVRTGTDVLRALALGAQRSLPRPAGALRPRDRRPGGRRGGAARLHRRAGPGDGAVRSTYVLINSLRTCWRARRWDSVRTMADASVVPDQPSPEDWCGDLACVPLFAGLERERVLAIARLADVERLKPGSEIVHVGDPASSFYLVLEGTAVAQLPDGRETQLARGDYFGELALFDESPRTGTVVTTDDVVVARIGRSSFIRLVEAEPKVALALLKSLTARVRASESAAAH